MYSPVMAFLACCLFCVARCLEELLNSGADLYSTDRTGCTALETVSRLGHQSSVDVIVHRLGASQQDHEVSPATNRSTFMFAMAGLVLRCPDVAAFPSMQSYHNECRTKIKVQPKEIIPDFTCYNCS